MEFDEKKEEPIVSPDTDNATHFHPEQAPPDQREKYRRFSLYNSGVYNWKWRDESKQRRIEKLAIYDAISDRLELTKKQRRKGRDVFDQLNLQKLGFSTELVAFCLCALVVRQDGRMYHPNRSDENNDQLFLDVAKKTLSRRNRKLILKCLGQLQACLSRRYPGRFDW